jgi:hypothetical protein
MMKVATGIALAVFIAAPASAQTGQLHHGMFVHAMPVSAFDVVGADNRVRRDPDPNIRVQLHREYMEGE